MAGSQNTYAEGSLMILATKSALRTGVEVKVLHIRERVAHRVRVWCAGAALVEAGGSRPTSHQNL